LVPKWVTLNDLERRNDLAISLYIKRGKVSICTSVMVGVASSVANDVIMRTGAAR